MATCVCVFTPFFADFPMPYPFSPYSLMVYTANLDDLSPDFLPRKSGFYHIYTIYMVEFGYGWQAISHGCTTKNGILSQKVSGHRGKMAKNINLKEKKSFLYRRITGQRGATENVVATCPDAPIIPRMVWAKQDCPPERGMPERAKQG